jgi:hypothetical protein
VSDPVKKQESYKKERSQRLDAVLRKIQKVGLTRLARRDVVFLEQCAEELRDELGVKLKSA